jgi:hypothetical protein
MMSSTRDALARQKTPALILAGVLFLGLWPAAQENLYDARWFRDLAHITPFHSVSVTEADLTPEGLMLEGEMVKRRCEFAGLTAYVTRLDGRRHRTFLDTAPEDGQRPAGNRPPSPRQQLWGPWIIFYGGPQVPLSWEIYASHDCPEEKLPQTNLFAAGDWPQGAPP